MSLMVVSLEALWSRASAVSQTPQMAVRSWSAMLSTAGVSTCESEARKECVNASTEHQTAPSPEELTERGYETFPTTSTSSLEPSSLTPCPSATSHTWPSRLRFQILYSFASSQPQLYVTLSVRIS